ncbi:MAG: divergent polysaccharide deacetylase family protein [Candidatus Acidiferrales bacterium]
MTRSRGRSTPPLDFLHKNLFGLAEFFRAHRFCKIASPFLASLGTLVFFSLAGCGKKPLTKIELRAITAEVVAAAVKVTQRKSEITIRPEHQPFQAAATGQLPADNIYVSLTDPAQTIALTRALDQIARRHKLDIVETSSGGVLRFDYAFNRTRTHTIHVVTPLAARARPPAKQGTTNPRLVIIVDDFGYDRAAADTLLALPFPLTVAVIPHLPLSSEVAEEAFRRGDQVLLHLPMESESDGAKPEEIELHVGMTPAQVDEALAGMLDSVPHAVGVNNHQGSRATADPALMQALMPALRQRGLFFIDSRTTAATVAYDTAERDGVRAASRRVFLDDTPTREAILAQLELAASDALRDGWSIAIGHPHPATIGALREGVPRLEARGIRLVFASDVVR